MLKKLLFTTFLTFSSGVSLMNKASFASPLISNKIPTNDIHDYVRDSEYTAKSVNGKVGYYPSPYYITYLIKFETNPSYNYNTKGLYLFLDLYNFMNDSDNYYDLLESVLLYGDYERTNYLDATDNNGGIIKYSNDMRLIMFNISFLEPYLTNQYLYLDLHFRVDEELLISDYISTNSSSIAQESSMRPILLYDTYYLMRLYGSSIGYTDGYVDGNNDGLAEGYDNGYNVGYNDGVASDFNAFSWLTAIFSGMGGLLSIQLLPDVTIGGVVILIMVLTLLPFLINLLKGGKD